MKKKIAHNLCIMFVIIISTELIACGKANTGKEIDTLADAKTDLYKSAAELEANAMVVVRVEKTEEEENVIKDVGVPYTYYGYTKSMVEVKEVMKNLSEQSIEIGDNIQILENQFFYTDEEGTKVTCHVNHYKMMEPGNEYILYLKYSKEDEWFAILSGVFGKIPISEDEELVFPSSKVTFLDGQPQQDGDDSYEKQIMEKIREESLEQYKKD